MQIVHLGDKLLEMSNPIFCKKTKGKNISECLLKLLLSMLCINFPVKVISLHHCLNSLPDLIKSCSKMEKLLILSLTLSGII